MTVIRLFIEKSSVINNWEQSQLLFVVTCFLLIVLVDKRSRKVYNNFVLLSDQSRALTNLLFVCIDNLSKKNTRIIHLQFVCLFVLGLSSLL